MPLPHQLPDPLEALQIFYGGLAEEVQSPEALQAEADFRLAGLSELVASKEWEVDHHGNLVPASMSDDDKRLIAEKAMYSIIQSVPKFINGRGEPVEATWTAMYSLMSDVTIAYV